MTTDTSCEKEVKFGPFRLNLQCCTLFREGVPVPLRSRSFDILRELVLSRGSLVSKDDLMSRVWLGLVVEENTIQVHVSALRKALGEGVGGARYIVTVPGRGYRFISESVESKAAAHVTIDAVPAPALPDKPSIAVLPFENMSGDPGQDYFIDGVVEDIITALSRFRQLFVIARNSSFAYRGKAVEIKQIGRELGVRYVLDGSVRKSGNRVRINAQLIDPLTGAHLWVDRLDGSLEDIFDLQDQVASRVAGAIAPTLEKAEIERVKRKPTENLDAYDCYLRAIASFNQLTREGASEALRLLYRSIELDHEFAAPYVWRRSAMRGAK
jgi:TolB-like protein